MPSCEVCKRKFTKARNVKRHVNEQHFEHMLFLCEECQSTFKRKSNLTQHLERKHSYTKEKARSACIKLKPILPNLTRNGFNSDIRIHTDISKNDEILDLVKELDDLLDSYIPEETSKSFIDDLLEATGNSTAVFTPSRTQHRRRRNQLTLTKLNHRCCKSHVLRLILSNNHKRCISSDHMKY